MVIDYYRARKAGGKVGQIVFDPAEHDVAADDDFSEQVWPQELLNQAWKTLQSLEKQTGQPHYTVLRCQSDNPGLKAPQLAERLTVLLGKPYTSESVRQALHRAREKFAGFLLEEVEAHAGVADAGRVGSGVDRPEIVVVLSEGTGQALKDLRICARRAGATPPLQRFFP